MWFSENTGIPKDHFHHSRCHIHLVLKLATYQSSVIITVAMDTAVDISLVKVILVYVLLLFYAVIAIILLASGQPMFLCLSTPDTLILQSITQDQQSRNM